MTAPLKPSSRERITIEVAQPLIGLPIRTVQAMAANGEILGAAKMRRRWTFDRVKLEAWIVHKEQETWQNAQKRRPVASEGLPSGAKFLPPVHTGGRLVEVIKRLQQDARKRAKLAELEKFGPRSPSRAKRALRS